MRHGEVFTIAMLIHLLQNIIRDKSLEGHQEVSVQEASLGQHDRVESREVIGSIRGNWVPIPPGVLPAEVPTVTGLWVIAMYSRREADEDTTTGPPDAIGEGEGAAGDDHIIVDAQHPLCRQGSQVAEPVAETVRGVDLVADVHWVAGQTRRLALRVCPDHGDAAHVGAAGVVLEEPSQLGRPPEGVHPDHELRADQQDLQPEEQDKEED